MAEHSRFSVPAGLLALVACASSASASGSASVQLSGTLTGRCKVEFVCPGVATCTSLRFAAKLASRDKDTPNDSTGTIKWSCNAAGQAVGITFTSARGGVLRSMSGNSSIPYVVSLSGQNIAGFTGESLSTPKTSTGMAMAAMSVYTGLLTLNTPSVPSNLQAGSYEDTISVTINPSGL